MTAAVHSRAGGIVLASMMTTTINSRSGVGYDSNDHNNINGAEAHNNNHKQQEVVPEMITTIVTINIKSRMTTTITITARVVLSTTIPVATV